MTLQKAIFKIDGDVDSDGVEESGEFHMRGNLEITPSMRTGYLIGGRGSTFAAIASDVLGSGQTIREGIFLDLGGGARVVEVRFRQWEGSGDQWGNDDSPSKTQASATDQDPITQIDVLTRYLEVAEIDSRNPATLEYGEYSSGGLYSPMDVVVEGPNFTRAAEDGSWFTGTMTFVSAADIDDAIHAVTRLG